MKIPAEIMRQTREGLRIAEEEFDRLVRDEDFGTGPEAFSRFREAAREALLARGVDPDLAEELISHFQSLVDRGWRKRLQ